MRCKNAGENLETYMIFSNGVIDSRKALDSYGEIETTTNHIYFPEREGGRESPKDSERERERAMQQSSPKACISLTHARKNRIGLVGEIQTSINPCCHLVTNCSEQKVNGSEGVREGEQRNATVFSNGMHVINSRMKNTGSTNNANPSL